MRDDETTYQETNPLEVLKDEMLIVERELSGFQEERVECLGELEDFDIQIATALVSIDNMARAIKAVEAA